jgi:hypothetical protein
MTLQSGSAMANTSAYQCLVNADDQIPGLVPVGGSSGTLAQYVRETRPTWFFPESANLSACPGPVGQLAALPSADRWITEIDGMLYTSLGSTVMSADAPGGVIASSSVPGGLDVMAAAAPSGTMVCATTDGQTMSDLLVMVQVIEDGNGNPVGISDSSVVFPQHIQQGAQNFQGITGTCMMSVTGAGANTAFRLNTY